jgi:rare lipoprotein A
MRKLFVTLLLLLALGGATGTAAQARMWQSAQASWYGPGLYGNGLGCGGTLTSSTWGVAHKYLPCGTRVHICYQRRCVVARVIDRGPYVAGRDFDLTAPVRYAIGMPGVGVIQWWIG